MPTTTKSLVKTRPKRTLEWPVGRLEPFLPYLEAPRGVDLPGSDGEPMENERERTQINLALESLDQEWSEREDFYTGGNMFVYYRES